MDDEGSDSRDEALGPEDSAPPLDPPIEDEVQEPWGPPREYLEFEIKYLTGLKLAYTNELGRNISPIRDTGGAMESMRPSWEHFNLGMGAAGFSGQEVQQLWHNYMGEHPQRHNILAELREDIERLEAELETSTNDEHWEPTQLMDWGIQRTSDGEVIGPVDSDVIRAKALENAERLKGVDLQNALREDLVSRLAEGVDPVEALDHALSEIEAEASLLREGADPSTWTEQETSDFLEQQSLSPEEVDPVAALDHELAEQEAGQSLLTEHEVEEVQEQASLVPEGSDAEDALDQALDEQDAQQSLPEPSAEEPLMSELPEEDSSSGMSELEE
jgi:hypothetical protein